jgi:hypothetical protein
LNPRVVDQHCRDLDRAHRRQPGAGSLLRRYRGADLQDHAHQAPATRSGAARRAGTATLLARPHKKSWEPAITRGDSALAPRAPRPPGQGWVTRRPPVPKGRHDNHRPAPCSCYGRARRRPQEPRPSPRRGCSVCLLPTRILLVVPDVLGTAIKSTRSAAWMLARMASAGYRQRDRCCGLYI